MKRTIIALALFMPALCFAAGAASPSTKSTKVKTTEKTTTSQVSVAKEINLTGGTEANRIEIEKIAKEQGAEQASFDATTGVLKFNPSKKFNEAKFLTAVEKSLPGVSLKK